MTRPAHKTPHLLEHWDQVRELISSSRRTVVFLDFDGTLVPIASRPNQVWVQPPLRRILSRLARQPRVTLAIISGRRRAEIQGHIQLRGVRYLGLFGWEGASHARIPAKARRDVSRARAILALRGFPHAGIWIENKRCSLSVHLLGAAVSVRSTVRREIRAALRPFRGRLRLFENLHDLEIVPSFVHGKGVAVRHFLARPSFRKALPIYFGDDFSDEPAFAAVHRGISVLVANVRETNAQFRLRGPGELFAALKKLEAALE